MQRLYFGACQENTDGDKSAKYVPYRSYAAFMNPFVIERGKACRLSICIGDGEKHVTFGNIFFRGCLSPSNVTCLLHLDVLRDL